MGVWTWYSIRMDILSSFVLTVACGFCVYLRTHTDPVLLTLMLQYIVTLQMYSTYTLY